MVTELNEQALEAAAKERMHRLNLKHTKPWETLPQSWKIMYIEEVRPIIQAYLRALENNEH